MIKGMNWQVKIQLLPLKEKICYIKKWKLRNGFQYKLASIYNKLIPSISIDRYIHALLIWM